MWSPTTQYKYIIIDGPVVHSSRVVHFTRENPTIRREEMSLRSWQSFNRGTSVDRHGKWCSGFESAVQAVSFADLEFKGLLRRSILFGDHKLIKKFFIVEIDTKYTLVLPTRQANTATWYRVVGSMSDLTKLSIDLEEGRERRWAVNDTDCL